MVGMTFLLLLLLASASRVDLVDEVVEIPPSEWRYVELNLKQPPVFVACEISAGEGDSVRAALMRGEDFERLRGGRPHGLLAATPSGERGALRFAVREPGKYVVVVDNGSEHPAKAHLRVGLDFSASAEPVRYLSRRRRWTVILLSFAFFFGVTFYSARRLLGGARPPRE